MIRREELRLGNFIEYQGDTHTVRQIGLFKVSTGWHDLEYDLCEPINLSPEYLERFGFTLQPNGIWWLLEFETKRTKGSIGVMCFMKDGVTVGGTIQIGNDVRTQAMRGCKYVHELQNLYFVLSGEELELKQ